MFIVVDFICNMDDNKKYWYIQTMPFTKEDIDEFVFDDPDIDNIKQFNYKLRAKLIAREIRKEDYLLAEEVLLFGRRLRNGLKAFVKAFEE